MAEETVPICRLCLEVVYDGRFQEAESIIIILQNVLPNLNFSISSHPLICSKCTETLQKSFNFKSACVDTEKHLQNYQCNGSSVIHLEEVVHNKCLEKEVKMEKVDKGKICRFCLQILEGELSIPLGVIEQDMLGKCLPELDLTVSENPVICQTCLECLQNQFNFVMSCSDVEERIENYCSTQGTNSDGQVNLQDVLLVLPLKMHKVKFDRNDTCNGLKDVKVELENNSSSNIEQSNMEYDEIFIKDEVSTESGHDNLDFYQIKLHVPKTAAEHSGRYRAQKRSEKPEKAKPKTAAERMRMYRARKRSGKPEKAKPQTAAEYMRAYRARKRSEMSEKAKLKTAAEHIKMYRAPKRAGKPEKAKSKTAAEYMRAYRARKRSEKSEKANRKRSEKLEKARPKTSTERVREFRNRKRQQLEPNQSHLSAKKPKTSTERVREFRNRKRQQLEPNQSHLSAKKPKTSTERVREFRNRKRRQLEPNQSHLSAKSKK